MSFYCLLVGVHHAHSSFKRKLLCVYVYEMKKNTVRKRKKTYQTRIRQRAGETGKNNTFPIFIKNFVYVIIGGILETSTNCKHTGSCYLSYTLRLYSFLLLLFSFSFLWPNDTIFHTLIHKSNAFKFKNAVKIRSVRHSNSGGTTRAVSTEYPVNTARCAWSYEPYTARCS